MLQIAAEALGLERSPDDELVHAGGVLLPLGVVLAECGEARGEVVVGV